MSRSEGNVEQNRELEEMMIKMNELRRYERSLMEDLSTIKTENNIEVLVFGGPKPAKSTESQRSSKKIFNSINGFPTIKFSEHLTTSIRSVNGDTTTKSIASLSPQNSTKLIHTPLSNTKQSYIPQTSNTNQPHT